MWAGNKKGRRQAGKEADREEASGKKGESEGGRERGEGESARERGREGEGLCVRERERGRERKRDLHACPCVVAHHEEGLGVCRSAAQGGAGKAGAAGTNDAGGFRLVDAYNC